MGFSLEWWYSRAIVLKVFLWAFVMGQLGSLLWAPMWYMVYGRYVDCVPMLRAHRTEYASHLGGPEHHRWTQNDRIPQRRTPEWNSYVLKLPSGSITAVHFAPTTARTLRHEHGINTQRLECSSFSGSIL